MWTWILLIILPFTLLAFIEEVVLFFVRRHLYGPGNMEKKLKEFCSKAFSFFKSKLKSESTAK